MIAVSPLAAAVSAHRAAWDAFQVAPEGEESEWANDAMCDAQDALMMAACAFPLLGGPLPAGADALLAHLRWWLAEEADFAADYQPAYGILQGRAADLAAVLEPPGPDPILPALAAVRAAEHRDRATLAASAGDEVAEAEAACDAAAAERDAATVTLLATLPTTLAGAAALARYHAADMAYTDGADALAHLAEALAGVPAPAALPQVQPDPILALIEAADAANAAHTAICEVLDEDDDEQMERHNDLTHASWVAFQAVQAVLPTTRGGLHALAAFYVRTAELYERDHIEHLELAIAQVLP